MQYLQQAGDAPPLVRSGVLTALKTFQDGYIKRDQKDIDSFMGRVFAKNGDVLIQGTDAGEWARGYPAATEFIREDWKDWGDFRFAADEAIIWSSGDVAWIASLGTVHFIDGSDRPLRISAILSRDGSNWLFREVHFQWDEHDPDSTDILRFKTYLRLAALLFRRMMHGLGEVGAMAKSHF
jgi:hypothetical protein